MLHKGGHYYEPEVGYQILEDKEVMKPEVACVKKMD